MKVGDCYKQYTDQAYTVSPRDKLDRIIMILSENPVSRLLSVVDGEGRLAGIIRMMDVLAAVGLKYHQEASLLKARTAGQLRAEDIMRAPVSVKLADTLDDALEKAVRHSVNELPVVDGEDRVIGELNSFEILANARIQ